MARCSRRRPLSGRVGVIAVGHHTYWSQFDGLRDELLHKLDVLVRKVRKFGVEVETFGLIDRAEPAYSVVPRIRAADIDLLFVDMVTYATSATFGVLARELRDLPIVLVALQPQPALDYERATTHMQLRNDDICAVPEFTGVAVRMGRPAPPVVLGMIEGDPAADAELAEWCAIARALHDLRRARIGHMGHVLEAMLDMHTDPTALTAAFGCHVVQCEPDELLRAWRRVSSADIAARKKDILEFFDAPDPGSDPVAMKLTDDDLTAAARASCALDAFIEEKQLDGLAYYYEGEPDSELGQVMSSLIVGNSMLCAAGFPMCGEFDVKTCVAMLIMDRLDMGGSFAEFHPVDFRRGTVLVGHDGPHHLGIADRKPVLRSLRKYHGKPGAGASVEFSIRHGPITLLSIGVGPAGAFRFVIAEGESVPGPIPPTGNTNTHGRFAPDVRTFLRRWFAAGPTHHFALGVGRRAAAIEAIGRLCGVETFLATPRSACLWAPASPAAPPG